MDNIVIILIAAGVCCVVIGTALFIKLLTVKPAEAQKKTLLDEDYIENFKECFENTGNIEETLDQLSDIYMGNQYMHSLLADAIDFIHNDNGDYETALEKINVDDDMDVLKMHNTAIKKTLEKKNGKMEHQPSTPKQPEMQGLKRDRQIMDELFEEDEEESEEEPEKPEKKETEKGMKPAPAPQAVPVGPTGAEAACEAPSDRKDPGKSTESKPFTEVDSAAKPNKAEPKQEIFKEQEEDDEDDDDDLDGFKIG